MPGTRKDVKKLILALALERDHTEHLAGEQIEGSVLQPPRAEVARTDPRREIGVVISGLRYAALLQLGDALAQHQFHNPVLRAGCDIDDSDRLAIAQHGCPVTDGGDLD